MIKARRCLVLFAICIPGLALSPLAEALGGPGAFDDAYPRYHTPENIRCNDCHVSYRANEQIKGPNSQLTGAASGQRVNNPWLLPVDDTVELCLSCHDDMAGTPDVVGSDINDLVQRSAGFFARPGERNPNGHDLSWGPGRTSGAPSSRGEVTCIDCHDPHGNGVTRILRPSQSETEITQLGLFVNPGARGMARYESENVAYGTLNSHELREPSSICIDCHARFAGRENTDSDGDGIYSRHPTYDSRRQSMNTIAQGNRRGSTNPGHWDSGVGSGFNGMERLRPVVIGATSYLAASKISARENGVSCLTCHRAHGSSQPFALNWPTQRNPSAGCNQCHGLGDDFGAPPFGSQIATRRP
jgi:hypothetical protein